MSPELRASSKGIGDTTEWRLISGLRQSSDRFTDLRGLVHWRDGVGVGSAKTLELRTALRDLNIQIYTTFTILRLELLLHLESELEDDTSQSSSELESEDESRRGGAALDRDDASSQSSVISHRIVPSEKSFDILDRSPSSSGNQGSSLLRDLCSLLEARVNPLLIPVEPGESNRASGYPRLARLIEYVQSLPNSFIYLGLIPIPRSRSTPFLFNVAEDADAATADAFVAFSDLTQKRPRKATRQRMLAKVEFLRDRFLAFNNFVNSLQVSTGCLDNLAARPSRGSTSTKSFASFALLQKFRQQTAAACRAIFSQFGFCAHRTSMKHKILLQLPDWEDVSECHSTDGTGDLPVQLFFTRCPGNDWQPASMYFLRPEHTNACKSRTLCQALISSHNDDRDLEFYVSEDCKRAEPAGIPIHIPLSPKRCRRYGDSFPNYRDSLWTLIERGYFAKEQSIDLLLNTDGRGTVLRIDQRKTLAVKLVIGLMLSMDSDHIIDSWDPERIHFLEPVDTEYTPFVSIEGNTDNSNHQDCLSLAKLYITDGLGNNDDPEPLPPFALLAKALLHVARGDRLETVKFSQASEGAFRHAWKTLRRMVDQYIRIVACGEDVDRKALPFLHAALNCLDFHMLYQERVNRERAREARPCHRMEIAWQLVFDAILAKIDSNLTLRELVQPRNDVLSKEEPVPVVCQTVTGGSSVVAIASSTQPLSVTTVVVGTRKEELSTRCVDATTTQPSQPDIALFDGEPTSNVSTETQKANFFFKMLEEFHASYSRFATDRVTDSWIESPRRIRIAVLDTGIDFRHPAIMEAKDKGRMKQEWCHSWVGADVRDEDDELHGTNCAYLLHKAAPEAEIYIEKVFERNSFRHYQAENIARVRPFKSGREVQTSGCRSWGLGDGDSLISRLTCITHQAINHAVKTWDVDIISMSFGLRPPTPRTDGNQAEELVDLQRFEDIVDSIETAIRAASAQSPRIILAAASNNGKNEKRAFPARYNPWVICVHASDGYGADGGINPPRESGANFMTLGMGHELMERDWVCVGGRKIPKYNLVYKSGTSFATPVAAGVAATVLDLAARVRAIKDRTREKLKRPEEMEKMLRLMSSPSHDFGDQYYFLAPWNHWTRRWQSNEIRSRMVWDSINDLFSA